MSHWSVQGEQSTSSEITALTNLAALAASGAGEFIYKVTATTFGNRTLAEGLTLSNLSDVTITSPINGQILTYNGSSWVNSSETGLGTVTSVSVVTANGVSGSVATATTTPAITLTLGAITPTTVTPTGQFLAVDGTTAAPGYAFASQVNTGLYWPTSALGIVIQGTERIRATASGLQIGTTEALYWSTGLGGALDVGLLRDAAAQLAQRNGTTAQEFHLYGTFTDASNKRLAAIVGSFSSSMPAVVASGAGTGANPDLYIGVADGTGSLRLYLGGSTQWLVNTSGHLLTGTDNTVDIGASGATRPRTGYFATSVVAPTATLSSTGTALTFSGTGVPNVNFDSATYLMFSGGAGKPVIIGHYSSATQTSIYLAGGDGANAPAVIQAYSESGTHTAIPLYLITKGTSQIRFGAANAASPVAQTLAVQGSRGGTDVDVSGASLTIQSGIGTGAAAASSLIFQTPTVGGTGSVAQTMATRLTVATASITSTVPLALGANDLTMTGSLAATGARVTKGWFTDLEVTNGITIGGAAYYLPLGGGTMTGNITLGEGADPATSGIVMDASMSADERYSGVTVPGTAGATLAFGDICYLDVTATEWLLADASAASTAGDVILGICVDASTDGNATSMLLLGTVRSAAFPASIALGAPVYVSETAGDITATAPVTTDSVMRRVGWAVTAEPNTIFFNPSNDYVTHT